jgi:hypothetical protein
MITVTALKGVVTGNVGLLKVQLPTGSTLRLPQHETLKIGDPCLVLYDYTTMKVRKVEACERERQKEIFHIPLTHENPNTGEPIPEEEFEFLLTDF